MKEALLFSLLATPLVAIAMTLTGILCGKLYRLAFKDKLDRLADALSD